MMARMSISDPVMELKSVPQVMLKTQVWDPRVIGWFVLVMLGQSRARVPVVGAVMAEDVGVEALVAEDVGPVAALVVAVTIVVEPI
jgi:hypothetical protein